MMEQVYFSNQVFTNPGVEILPFDIIKDHKMYTDRCPFSPHVLHFYCIVFITEGKEGIHHIDFKPHEYKAGNVIIISKEQAQAFETLPLHDGILLSFTEDYLIELDVDKQYLTLQLNNIVFSNPIVKVPPAAFSTIISLLTLAKQESSMFSFEKSEIIKAYIRIVLLKVLGVHKEENEKGVNLSEIEEFLQFQQLLFKHKQRKKDVLFYANQLHISPKKLSILSKNVVGQTAKEYIISFIMLEAKRLLKCSNISIKEISFRLGFDEPTNFTKFFKKHAKLLPSAFVND